MYAKGKMTPQTQAVNRQVPKMFLIAKPAIQIIAEIMTILFLLRCMRFAFFSYSAVLVIKYVLAIKRVFYIYTIYS